jgi:uncharacterized protein
MAVIPTYPGVYIEEIPSGVRAIASVSTSDTAFIDFFARGPLDQARRITSFADFERIYGGLDTRSEASYALQQYYLNGGSVAYVIRVASGAAAADALLPGLYDSPAVLRVAAANPGIWGNRLQVQVDSNTLRPDSQFNLTVREVETVNGRVQILATESYRNLEMNAASPRYALNVVNSVSSLISLSRQNADETPLTGSGVPAVSDWISLGTGANTVGHDGTEPTSDAWLNGEGATALVGSESEKTGLYALENIAPRIFNLLCIPAAANLAAGNLTSVVTAATAYAKRKRAFFLVDIPESVASLEAMDAWMGANDGLRDNNAAIYFPRLNIPDALNENRPRNVAPSGTLAAVYARTDSARGVWKAPAGTDADLRGADVVVRINDLENGGLNPLGVNCLRSFPIYGPLSWGARTLDGSDQMASEWKYIPVRRTALFIEESLYQGLKWVVFEPNDEPLWAQIRQNVGAFMQGLFRQGAFQGNTPRAAYFVRCGSDTTTSTDQDLGIVNIVVGFAPLKPAEFVIVKIQQMAGQAAA